MSLMRSAFAKNWMKEMYFNPSDNIPIHTYGWIIMCCDHWRMRRLAYLSFTL